MTYCVGVALEQGLVLMSDTRTNAGVDDVAMFNKMFVWEHPGERCIVILTAGNLAISQAVINVLDEGLPGEDGTRETLLTVPSMFQAARLVGRAVRSVYAEHGEAMRRQEAGFNVSLLLGGQLNGRTLRLFQVYSAGNFIETMPETPFLQIGEHKYGKPILDRTLRYNSSLEEAVKACLVSMDSTLKSNLSVGMPIDIAVLPRDTCRLSVRRRIGEDDAYFRALRERWSQALRDAFHAVDLPDWIGAVKQTARRRKGGG